MKKLIGIILLTFALPGFASSLITIKEPARPHKKPATFHISEEKQKYFVEYIKPGKTEKREISSIEYNRFKEKLLEILLKRESQKKNCAEVALSIELKDLKESGNVCAENLKSYHEVKGMMGILVKDIKIMK